MSIIHEPFIMLLSGIQCSGKSTFALNIPQPPDISIISTDMFIEAAARETGQSYNDIWASKVKLAEVEMYRSLDRLVENKKNIVWDQTNLTRSTRQKKMMRIPKSYYKIGVFFVNADLSLLLERNRARHEKCLPESVIMSAFETYEVPINDKESFDVVKYIDARTLEPTTQIIFNTLPV